MDCAILAIPNPLFQPEEVNFAQKFQVESLCHQLSSGLQLMLTLAAPISDKTILQGWDFGQSTLLGRLGPTTRTWGTLRVTETTDHPRKLPKFHTGPAHFVGYLTNPTSWTTGTCDKTWPMMVSALGRTLVTTSTTTSTTFPTQTQVCYHQYPESTT